MKINTGRLLLRDQSSTIQYGLKAEFEAILVVDIDLTPTGSRIEPSTMQSDANDAPVTRSTTRATAHVVVRDKEWKKNKMTVGSHISAMLLIIALMGSENIDPEQFARMQGKTIRQFGQKQTSDEGNDVSGYIVVSDAGAALLFKTDKDGRQWAMNHNQVNISLAPSLTYIASGNPNVSLFTSRLAFVMLKYVVVTMTLYYM